MDPEMLTDVAYATKGNPALRRVIEHLFERFEGAAPAAAPAGAPAVADDDGDTERKLKNLDAKIRRRDKKIEALEEAVAELKEGG